MRIVFIFFIIANICLGFAQEPKVTSLHVAGSIHMLQGSGGNIGVCVGEDGIFLVDDKFANFAAPIEASLAKLKSGPVKFVLNTHWHGDHTGSNPHFGTKSTIIAHKNVRKRLKNGQEIKFFNMKAPPMEKAGLPVVTFETTVSVHFNGEEIKIIHFPKAHTDGDSVVFFDKSKVVHLGDLFFKDRFPFVDLESGGSVRGLRDRIATLLKKIPEDYKIIPGHGSLATHKDLQNFHSMLKQTISYIAQEKKKLSLEKLIKKGLPKKWKSWRGFINEKKWITMVYKDLENQ